jgi:hypothetical protein
MTDFLERRPLPVRMADLIEQSIREGDWANVLPGHRVLMKRYGVSAKTTLAAITVLENRGIISKGKQGENRTIIAKSRSARNRAMNLLVIDGRGASSGEDLRQIEAYRAVWEECGGRVLSVRYDYPRYRRPGTLIASTVASHSADALLLHNPPLGWTKAAVALRPVFLSGGEWSGLKLSGVGYHLGKVAGQWALKLREMGHERILMPLGSTGESLIANVRECMAPGLGLRANSTLLREYCPVIDERVPEVWQACWRRMFSNVRPTAVIVTDDIHYLSLSGYCSGQGIRIPRDLSIVCLESTEHLEWCDPTPTRMRFPVEAAAAHFRKWALNGCQSMGMKFFDLEYAGGKTIAPPRH